MNSDSVNGGFDSVLVKTRFEPANMFISGLDLGGDDWGRGCWLIFWELVIQSGLSETGLREMIWLLDQ